jgi:uncharacterized protein
VSPKFLPLISQIGTRHGSRSYRTCEFKCANQCDQPEPNPSGNEHIQTVMRSAFSRRNVLEVGAAGVAAAGAARSRRTCRRPPTSRSPPATAPFQASTSPAL